MTDFQIAPQTHIGQVGLRVWNLDDSIQFYVAIIGLKLLEKSEQRAVLGVGKRPLLVLNARPDWLPKQRGVGLYHFALLVPDRVTLAASLQHLVKTATRLQGAADHFVSEALYLADPEGNGIEIYADRPRETWEKLPNGQLRIGTIPLDINALWKQHDGSEFVGLPESTIIGHVHLHASPQLETVDFYKRVIGMDEMGNYGPFYFLSAGGYHHHIALQPALAAPKPKQAGLDWYEIVLPDVDARYDVAERIARAGLSIEEVGTIYEFSDPAHHRVRLVLEEKSEAGKTN